MTQKEEMSRQELYDLILEILEEEVEKKHKLYESRQRIKKLKESRRITKHKKKKLVQARAKK